MSIENPKVANFSVIGKTNERKPLFFGVLCDPGNKVSDIMVSSQAFRMAVAERNGRVVLTSVPFMSETPKTEQIALNAFAVARMLRELPEGNLESIKAKVGNTKIGVYSISIPKRDIQTLCLTFTGTPVKDAYTMTKAFLQNQFSISVHCRDAILGRDLIAAKTRLLSLVDYNKEYLK